MENTDSRSDLKEIEVILLKIRKLQDSLLEKAMKNNANKEKIGTLKNLLSKSKMSNIKLLEKSDEENKNLDDLLDKLWNE
ncbi:MAG: hypothetical protein N4A38_03560 [Candidatus Gracilibacteria bacterium]|nr:hypothetical protein [Candidatus Gracilibacteria bacterium]